ncbi:PqqD family peptide modification chaperone [Streptomyces jumonjinensis]|uniref:PqqD family peptide modification chaperone n=1 Tax=Streptomyces jumonjinensis TaxID=1945 RepID=UPI0037BBAA5E
MRLRRGVHPAVTETAGALLDERSGRWLQLTGTAAVALRQLLSTEEREQAVAGYAGRFAVPREQAEQDLASVESYRTVRAGGTRARATTRPSGDHPINTRICTASLKHRVWTDRVGPNTVRSGPAQQEVQEGAGSADVGCGAALSCNMAGSFSREVTHGAAKTPAVRRRKC